MAACTNIDTLSLMKQKRETAVVPTKETVQMRLFPVKRLVEKDSKFLRITLQ